MTDLGKPIANPLLVLRQESDDWAILFHPDTGDTYALDPVGVFIFQHLDGKTTLTDLMQALKTLCPDLPASAEQEVQDFIENLVKRGYAGYEVV